MLIKISDELINNKDELGKVIHYIAMKGGAHSICSENFRKLLNETAPYPSINENIKNLIEKQVNHISFEKTIEVTISDESNGKVTIDKLDQYLSKPPLVIVENEINDLNFIKLILFSTGNRKVVEAHGKFWDTASIGGCGQIPALIEHKIRTKTSSCKIFVLHDSDRFYPQENLSRTHINIINKCRTFNISHHTLAKREAENYITDSYIFDKNQQNTNFCTAWKSLTEAQKSHYDFKYGFSRKSHTHQVYGGLFNGLSPEIEEELHNGFGEDIANDVYTDEHYSYYSKDKIMAWSPNVNHEFKKISDSIKSIL